jgi:TRAP-type C4-dicarboxylate transport system permease large subunit
MGQFVLRSGIGVDLFDTAHKWIGRFPGGLATATTVAATAFGACCGASTASAATFASVAYPEMAGLSINTVWPAVVLPPVVSQLFDPPSVGFIVYGVSHSDLYCSVIFMLVFSRVY